MSDELITYEVVTERDRVCLSHIGCRGTMSLPGNPAIASLTDLVGVAALHDAVSHQCRGEIQQHAGLADFKARIVAGRIVLGHRDCAGTATFPVTGPAPLAEMVSLAGLHITRGHAGVW